MEAPFPSDLLSVGSDDRAADIFVDAQRVTSGERLVLANNKKQETAGTIMPSVATNPNRCLVDGNWQWCCTVHN